MGTTNEVLTLSLRPKTLSSMVGQQDIAAMIKEQIGTGRIPRTWMLIGESGAGKTTLARILALSFQGKMGTFGEPTEKMWEQYRDYAIHEINASHLNGVEAMSTLVDDSVYAPMPPSKYRVYILDEAHRISSQAQNLLLKPFEEPPSQCVWIVCTTDPQKLLPTLQRRCYQIRMRPLGEDDVRRLAKRVGTSIKCDKPLVKLVKGLNRAGVTASAHVVRAVELYASGASVKQSVLAANAEVDNLRVCRAFLNRDWSTIREELKAATPDEAMGLRMNILGYCRAVLLNGSGDSRLAQGLRNLSQPIPYEAGAASAWLAATLYLHCQGK